MNKGVHISFLITVFVSFGKIPRSAIAGSYGGFTFYFLRKLRTVFHRGCTNLSAHQQYMGSLFSTSLTTLVICYIFYNTHSDRCEMISHCGFDLHFPDDSWCWVSFDVPFSHLYVFFGKMSIQVLYTFVNEAVWFFWCSSVWVLCILDINSCWVYNLQISSSIQ